jgi:hypothetical protein
VVREMPSALAIVSSVTWFVIHTHDSEAALRF